MKRFNPTPQALGLVAALCLQYLLGIWSNLFVAFPDTTDAGELWKFALTQWPVVAHLILGTLLIFGSLTLLVRAFRSGDRLWKTGSGLGFGAILLAWLSGREFVTTQNDIASYAMATFFITALLSYAITLYLAQRKAKSA